MQNSHLIFHTEKADDVEIVQQVVFTVFKLLLYPASREVNLRHMIGCD